MSSSESLSAAPDVPAPPAARRNWLPTHWRLRFRKLRLVGDILYHEIQHDQLFTQAAALTYKTLFSLLPVFVLSLLVLSKISSGEGRNALDVAVKKMLFEQLSIDKMQITDATRKTVAMRDFADSLITNASNSITNSATGWVAFGILLYGAISLMVVIESTFNQMFGSGTSRSWGRRIMLYWSVLTLGPLGIGASIAFGHAADTYAGVGWLLSTSNVLTSFILSWVVFLLLYKLVPQVRVNWRHAAIGSFLAAIAWEIGKWGFGLYMRHALRSSWYGSMAALPLFMFWIYISWSVVLMGLEVTYTQQHWRMMKRQFLFLRATRAAAGGFGDHVMLTDIRWAVSIGVMVCRRFKSGKTTSVEDAAEELMIPNAVAGAMLTAMERAGIVLGVAAGGSRYTLARPPETISACDLLTAARTVCGVPPELVRERGADIHTSGPMRELEDVETAWAKKRTLAELTA